MPTYAAISHELHRNKRWLRRTSLAFSRTDTVAPLFVNELAAAVQAMPIAFVKQAQGFVLVVVMGLKPGENVWVSAEGKWLADYMPVTYRSSPFELLAVTGQEGQQVLCIDQDCVTDSAEGEPFFYENGEVTAAISEVFKLVKQFNASRQLTQNMCAVLAEHGLISPWEIGLNNGVEQQSVAGLYKIDEALLNALSDEAFLALRQAGALPLVYCQLLSMQKIDALAQRIQPPKAEPSTKAAAPSVASETFDFSGLY
jgi:hypothetical protein